MTVDKSAVCLKCIHFRKTAPPSCDAFPERIPDLVWLDGDDHKQPIEGDHGIQFEPKAK